MSKPAQPPLERIEEKIFADPNTGCWIWTGTRFNTGYAAFHLAVNGKKKTLLAHRYVYQLLRGAIPGGMCLDHLCRTRECVNPQHLEIVTQRENFHRGMRPAQYKAITHCPRGHEYNEENTRLRKQSDGAVRRSCKACDRMWTRLWHERRKTTKRLSCAD